jgi:hypothetical protein
MPNELEELREGMWQRLHDHKRENEWSGVVIDLLTYLASQGVMMQTPHGIMMLSDLLKEAKCQKN